MCFGVSAWVDFEHDRAGASCLDIGHAVVDEGGREAPMAIVGVGVEVVDDTYAVATRP